MLLLLFLLLQGSIFTLRSDSVSQYINNYSYTDSVAIITPLFPAMNFTKRELFSTLALRLHWLHFQTSAAVIRPLWLLSSPFLLLHSGKTVSPCSIPLPQCFHRALITPICRRSSRCLSVLLPLLFCKLASLTFTAINA